MEIKELISKVEEKYTWEDILTLLDEEILNWDYSYSQDEIEEYDSYWDFYQQYNNKEAEDVVVEHILLSVGITTNELYDYDEGHALMLFQEWLEDYTSHNFEN